MKLKTVMGAGYGDEGKGLMTDYFCKDFISQGNKVLNIRVNGGAQAGHTVCRLENGYKHWVFRQYGSGTFADADTCLSETFMLNIDELLKERKALKEIYGVENKVYINKKCRVTLPIHILINRYIEEARDRNNKKHGTCGLGIYETFHMNECFVKVNLQTVIDWFINGSINDFVQKFNDINEDYLEYRRIEMEKCDGIIMNHIEFENILNQSNRATHELADYLCDLAKAEDIILVNSEDEAIEKGQYTAVVFECAQGLELDMDNKRNYPHLTPSHTGLISVGYLIRNNDYLKKSEDVEMCFVTRSYKTKHGAGFYAEADNIIERQYSLYDRTNNKNEYQGSIKYGTLDIGRMKRLILEQIDLFKNQIDIDVKSSISITHLDQTNEGLLTFRGRLEIDDVTKDIFGINTLIYKVYGEKANDVII